MERGIKSSERQKSDMEFLNNADSIHDEMIERLNQELQNHKETKSAAKLISSV